MRSEMTREVTELSDAPLAQALFEPPPGFKRVTQLSYRPAPSFSDQMDIYWQQVQRWFFGLFS